MPDEDDPSVFGMNIYAENMVRAIQADNLINSILIMEPLQTTGSRLEESKNDNEIVLEICKTISSEIPKSIQPTFTRGKHITFEEAMDKLEEKLGNEFYESSAINTILKQEIDRFNLLLKIMFKSIDELTKAIKGEIMISKQIENIISSLLVQKVPDLWEVID